MKILLLTPILIFFLSACVQNGSRQYQRLLTAIFKDKEVKVTLVGMENGPLSLNLQEPHFQEVRTQLSKVKGNWRQLKEFPIMLRAAEISFRTKDDSTGEIFVIAPDTIVVRDLDRQVWYGEIESTVWKKLWFLFLPDF